MSFFVIKASGEEELFHEHKLRRSLARAGADDRMIETIVADIFVKKPRTTKEIYRYAMQFLQKENVAVAARYNLKQALLHFGPAGYPFEKFIEKLYQQQGYQTNQGIVVAGICVPHEVDVIAYTKTVCRIIECKFRNLQSIKNDVKVPLYVKARFDDIQASSHKTDPTRICSVTIITNTKFTSMAHEYARCMNMELISWSYPEGNALPELIRQYKLHPITAIPHLSTIQQKNLIQKGLVLCQQAPAFEKELRQLGFTPAQAQQFIADARATCAL